MDDVKFYPGHPAPRTVILNYVPFSVRNGFRFDFGGALALTASHSDVIDYRAMLAREYGHEFVDRPAQIVAHEVKHNRLFREIYESTRDDPYEKREVERDLA